MYFNGGAFMCMGVTSRFKIDFIPNHKYSDDVECIVHVREFCS